MNPFAGHLALVIGHTRDRPGAYGVYPIDENEYGYNNGLAEILKRYGESRGHEIEIFYRDGIGIDGAYDRVAEWEPDAVCELHFNAFNGEVKGTETLYSDDNDDKKVKEKELAQFANDEICGVFNRQGRENRGLKNRPLSRGERGYWNVNQVFSIPSILIEPFFGDNKEDAKLAVENKQELAEAIIRAFERWKSNIAVERGLLSGDIASNTTATDTPDTRTRAKRKKRTTSKK